MALKIKDTPVLTGTNAEKFREALKKNELKKVSKEERERIKANYEKIQKISQ